MSHHRLYYTFRYTVGEVFLSGRFTTVTTGSVKPPFVPSDEAGTIRGIRQTSFCSCYFNQVSKVVDWRELPVRFFTSNRLLVHRGHSVDGIN